MQKIVIIGNGISGITAARHIRKHTSDEITVISAETEYFFSRTALMYIYMGHMNFEHTKPYEDWFWRRNNINLKFGYVKKVEFDRHQLIFNDGSILDYDKLIIATGSKPNKFGWPGQDLKGVQGLYSYQDLQLMEKSTKKIKKAVVVGGGLIGIEMVEMLISRGISVTFLVREQSFWDVVLPAQESAMINRLIAKHHVDLRLATELKEINNDGAGGVQSITISNGDEIECEFVGLTVGVHPNIDFLKSSELNINRGIVVNEYLETNIPNVYAIGDCAEHTTPPAGRRPVEQVWYTGKIMGETVAKTITGEKTAYKPGHWFNSAKFFDIEYQTYGTVTATRQENEEEFFWEHSDGNKCMHFIFNKKDQHFIGINTFGIRLRHEFFNKWLNEKRTINYILAHLGEANFDPEFFRHYEQEIIKAFNQYFPYMKVDIHQKKGIFSKIFAL